MLYELLTGEPPYTGPTAQAIVAKRLGDPIPSARRLRESVPPALDLVLQRLLAKSPADRYASAAELSRVLAALRESGPASPMPTVPSAATGRTRPEMVGAVLLVALVGALVAVRLGGRSAGDAAALDPAAVAVLPFRVTAPDRSLDYLGEGIVDLLAVKLDGSAGVRAVPPRQLLAALRYQPGAAITPEQANAAARRTGAGRVLDGSMVRSGGGVELSATLRRTDGAGRAVQAEASGSLDSLPALVDRLAARLLAGQAGSTPSLGELSSARAITAYLRGKAANRRGRYQDAVAAFEEALEEDSTFALAALDLIASGQRFGNDALDRPSRLAWTYRSKLTPKGRILLRAILGPRYPEPSSQIAQIAAWQEAVEAAPEQPESWFQLGDRQLHQGGLNDLSDPVERAVGTFRRALELDPTWVSPLDHILMAKLYLEDTTDFQPLAQRWLAQDTMPGDRSPYLRWRLGIALGDSALVARQRASLEQWNDEAVLWLAGNAQADAVGLGDVALAIRELERRAVTGPRLRLARRYRREWLLNTGRPAEALALTDSLASGEPFPGWVRITRIEDALFWDGDTTAAWAEVRVLGGTESSPDLRRLSPGARALAICRLGFWAMDRGDREGVRRWAGRLRADTAAGPEFNADNRLMCAELLDVWMAWREGRPEARRLLDRADSIYITSDVMDDWQVTNLVTARLREAVGDLPGAGRAIARVRVAMPASPRYQSTYLREQVRIALDAGDTLTAVRALRRYAALREGAAPALRAGADSARARLAMLVGR